MKKFVAPAPGMLVYNPETGGYLPKDGCEVEWNAHWRRIQKDGDIKVSDIKPAASAAVKKTPATGAE